MNVWHSCHKPYVYCCPLIRHIGESEHAVTYIKPLTDNVSAILCSLFCFSFFLVYMLVERYPGRVAFESLDTMAKTSVETHHPAHYY